MIATPVANPPMSSKFSFKKSFTSLKQPYNYKRTELIFTCSKSTIETLEKGVKYVQS